MTLDRELEWPLKLFKEAIELAKLETDAKPFLRYGAEIISKIELKDYHGAWKTNLDMSVAMAPFFQRGNLPSPYFRNYIDKASSLIGKIFEEE